MTRDSHEARDGRPAGAESYVTASAAAPGDASRAAARSDERFRAFVEQSAEGIWCFEVDPPVPTEAPVEGQIEGFYAHATLTECNATMARMYGFESPDQLVGVRLADLLPPDQPGSVEYLTAFIASGYRLTDAPTSEADRDGRMKHYLNNLIGTIEDGRLVRVWGTQRDITDVRRLEDHLRQAQKMEAIGLLAGGVAHDFNNQLTAILGFCQLAMTRPNLDPRVTRDLGEIRRAGESAAGLTRQLLAFSRQQMLQPRVVDPREIVARTSTMLARLLGEHIALVTPPATCGAVRVDPGQLEQVLMNLVVNARDAMPEGGRITVALEDVVVDAVHAGQSGGPVGPHVQIAVTDTGTGMDEATRQRIFEPFFTTKEAGRGTGLGLSTVYGIVQQSGGHIHVYSEMGHGTTFRILLPRVDAASAGAAAGEAGGAAIAPLEPCAILLVEDQPAVRALVRELLETRGHRVRAAATVSEALEAAAEDAALDVLLSDLVLPGGTGRALAQQVRASRPGIAVVYMSGFAEGALRQQAMDDADARVVQKPFTEAQLFESIRDALEHVRARRAA